MKVNHFSIRPNISFSTTTFSHAVPHQFRKYLKREGWVANARDDAVEIICRTDNVIPVFKGAQRGETTVIPFGTEAYFAALSGWIRVQLRKAGYVISRGQAVHPNLNRVVLQTPRRATPELNVHAHLQWEWEIEHHSGEHWLVIRSGRRYLSADTFASERLRSWLTDRPAEIQEAHAVNLVTGMSRRLIREQRQWRAPWETEDAGEWHLSFDMETLLTLNLSGHAADVSQFTMPQLVDLVKKEVVWTEFVTTTEALDIPAHEVQGQKLKFGRGFGREVSDVLKCGILEQPAHSVRLAVIVPDLQNAQKEDELKRELLAHLLPRATVMGNTRARQGLEDLRRKEGDDTLYTIWTENGRYQKLGLPAFDVAKGFHTYVVQEGRLLQPEALVPLVEQAQQDQRLLIAFVVLPTEIQAKERDLLFKHLNELGIPKCFSVSRDLLRIDRMQYKAWVNMAVKLARDAGAVPWDVEGLPGVDQETYFIGVDLGHDHRAQKSVPALTLHDYRGRPLECCVLAKRQGNERLNLKELTDGFARLLKKKKRRIGRVIVHRDGRFLEGEVDDFNIALCDNGVKDLTLVAVKKSNLTAVAGSIEGARLRLDGPRYLLVTSTQAALARPIEVELMHSDSLNLEEVTEQVFWLTRVFMNNAQHAGRVPATTEWANGIARTGKRVYLGW